MHLTPKKSPVTGYELAKISGVPRSMIYEVLGKLTARGAALTMRKDRETKHAPAPAAQFLNRLHREHTNADEMRCCLQRLLATLGLD